MVFSIMNSYILQTLSTVSGRKSSAWAELMPRPLFPSRVRRTVSEPTEPTNGLCPLIVWLVWNRSVYNSRRDC